MSSCFTIYISGITRHKWLRELQIPAGLGLQILQWRSYLHHGLLFYLVLSIGEATLFVYYISYSKGTLSTLQKELKWICVVSREYPRTDAT